MKERFFWPTGRRTYHMHCFLDHKLLWRCNTLKLRELRLKEWGLVTPPVFPIQGLVFWLCAKNLICELYLSESHLKKLARCREAWKTLLGGQVIYKYFWLFCRHPLMQIAAFLITNFRERSVRWLGLGGGIKGTLEVFKDLKLDFVFLNIPTCK